MPGSRVYKNAVYHILYSSIFPNCSRNTSFSLWKHEYIGLIIKTSKCAVERNDMIYTAAKLHVCLRSEIMRLASSIASFFLAFLVLKL